LQFLKVENKEWPPSIIIPPFDWIEKNTPTIVIPSGARNDSMG
jgi:hypothetical protein